MVLLAALTMSLGSLQYSVDYRQHAVDAVEKLVASGVIHDVERIRMASQNLKFDEEESTVNDIGFSTKELIVSVARSDGQFTGFWDRKAPYSHVLGAWPEGSNVVKLAVQSVFPQCGFRLLAERQDDLVQGSLTFNAVPYQTGYVFANVNYLTGELDSLTVPQIKPIPSAVEYTEARCEAARQEELTYALNHSKSGNIGVIDLAELHLQPDPRQDNKVSYYGYRTRVYILDDSGKWRETFIGTYDATTGDIVERDHIPYWLMVGAPNIHRDVTKFRPTAILLDGRKLKLHEEILALPINESGKEVILTDGTMAMKAHYDSQLEVVSANTRSWRVSLD